jgi:hypothetical protein
MILKVPVIGTKNWKIESREILYLRKNHLDFKKPNQDGL